MLAISELIQQLKEAQQLFGDIPVVFNSDYGSIALDFRIRGEFEVGLVYETLSGELETGDLETPIEELWRVDLNEPIRKALLV